MKRFFSVALAPALLIVAGCSGKTESAATTAADSAAVVPAAMDGTVADSAAAASADTLARLMGDSAVKKAMSAPVPAKAEPGDYDKAIRPRFKIDEKTGKVDTIKRP